MRMSRRFFLAMAASAASLRAAAEPVTEKMDLWSTPLLQPSDEKLVETVDAAGAISGILRPRLRIYRPAKSTGMAVIVAGGGGYKRIELAKESTPACRWLQSIGATAFELIYRLPREVSSTVAAFEDAQRAMRLVRSKAKEYDLDTKKIGIMGFSAGGHLAGMTAVKPSAEFLPALDAIDREDARPDFAALLYPVLTMMPPYDHTATRMELLGRHPHRHQSEKWSVELQVDADSPPMFLAQSEDDAVSPVENSILMYRALQDANVQADLQVFHQGGHGWGLGQPNTEPAAWPQRFRTWCTTNGFLGA